MRDSLPEDLQPHEHNLHRVVAEGLDLFNQRYGIHKGLMSLTTQRNSIHDCMVEVAQKIFGEKHCKRRGQLFLLVLGVYQIKLKKFNERIVTSSYRTQAVFEFLSQLSHTLFDIGMQNLQLGYVPSGLTTADYAVVIAKPMMSGRPEWHYELKGSVGAAAAPIFPVTNPNIAAQTRVVAKTSKLKKANRSERE